MLDNNLPVMISYSGYKTASGEFAYDNTIDNYPIVAVESKEVLIAEGKWSTGHTVWYKMGYNPDSGAIEEAINYIGGKPVWAATSGGVMSVVSANNLDAVGSSGCTQVFVNYLDSDYIQRSTIVSMNGTTAVNLIDTSIARINHFQVYAGNPCLGNVTIFTNTTDVLSMIGTGLTRARNSMYTVPSDRTLYINSIYYSAAGEGTNGRPTRFLLQSNYSDVQKRYSTSLFWPISGNLLKDEPIFAQLLIPIKIPEKSDIYTSVIMSAASSGNKVECILRGWLTENT